jgi:hypothetical protein
MGVADRDKIENSKLFFKGPKNKLFENLPGQSRC